MTTKDLPRIITGLDTNFITEFMGGAEFALGTVGGKMITLKCVVVELNEGGRISLGVVDPKSGLKDTLYYNAPDGVLRGEHFRGLFCVEDKTSEFTIHLVRLVRLLAKNGYLTATAYYPKLNKKVGPQIRAIRQDNDRLRAEVVIGEQAETSIFVDPSQLTFHLS